ncbi:hypothetical protein FNH13_10910 [Ornithinimicrobium ciconiae]|uniref:DUF485 domain-containing protein n=1 Tax=Ornithinimicrobium ciconiae TaxID=2594265 RepID=A0A516GB70_9MICO|nr:hypothetical protein [Ornithinimicrobium ciconiae]QDO88771.1 hypothetical protein FNH13_10910 [Ornithinimicrobium ciconiae]
MSERVTVTHPSRARPRVRPAPLTREIDEQTGLGEVYISSLIRSQLRLSLVVLAVSLGVLASLPLVFHLLPHVAEIRVLGITLPWLILGAVVYPALLGAAWFYARNAERIERDFVDLLDHR